MFFVCLKKKKKVWNNDLWNFFLLYILSRKQKKNLFAESINFLFKMEHLHFDVGGCRVGRVQITEKEAHQAKSKWRSQKD